MAKTVILSVADGEWNVWGERFVKRQLLQRAQRTIAQHVTAAATKDAIIAAAQAAGTSGVLIISVGHGGIVEGGTTAEGKFELGPNGAMTIAGGLVDGRFIDVFYDTRKNPAQPSDLENDTKNNPNSQFLKNFKLYKTLSIAIKAVHLQRVVLLTCRVGNSTEFLRKVANDWGVVIQAYRKRVGIQTFVGTGSFAGTQPIRIVFLDGDAATMTSPASKIHLQEEEIPFDPAQTFLVGPPL